MLSIALGNSQFFLWFENYFHSPLVVNPSSSSNHISKNLPNFIQSMCFKKSFPGVFIAFTLLSPVVQRILFYVEIFWGLSMRV